jgi:hypothetical protein
MKKMIASLSVAILLILSYGIAIGAPPNNVSDVNVVNTPNVNVSKTATQLLYSTTSYPLPALTGATLATVDVSSCDSVRFSFAADYCYDPNNPSVSCALIDNLAPFFNVVVAGAQASLNFAGITGCSASVDVKTPSSGSLKIYCVNQNPTFDANVSVALYCR